MMPEPLGQPYLEECQALSAFVDGLDEAAFARVTDFYGWTVRDEVMHMMFVDVLTLRSIEDEAGYLEQKADIRRYQAEAGELSQYMRERYADLDRDALVALWRDRFTTLAAVFAASNPKSRMKWFGPDMSILSATSARQMEVWAHGQDLYDLFGIVRRNTDRIRNICEIGVRTYGWSFKNRGLELPGPAPSVALTAPSGAIWTWDSEPGAGKITGPAEDFAAVVTQRRDVKDTDLVCEGEAASQWMAIAQCFAGEAADGPAPGRPSLRGAKVHHAV
jgi:uncharacterized protein (TIGR03084 family)